MKHVYNLRWIYLWCLLVGLMPTAQAQDPVFAQYWAHSMYLNPALTAFEGGTSVAYQLRDQWSRVDGSQARFRTNSIGISSEVPCWNVGLGAMFTRNVEGAGLYTWQRAGLSFAWRSPADRNRGSTTRGQINLGAAVSANWYSIDWSRLRFSDQLDPFTGFTGTGSNFQGPGNGATMPRYVDLDYGMAYVRNWGTQNQLRVGASFYHLIGPDPTFFSQASIVLPTRITLHASWILTGETKGGQRLQIVPLVRSEIQAAHLNVTRLAQGSATPIAGAPRYTYLSGGALANLLFDRAPSFWIGGVVQSGFLPLGEGLGIPKRTHSLIGMAGFRQEVAGGNIVRMGVSYDWNLTGPRTPAMGALEIFVSLRFADRIIPIGHCGRMGSRQGRVCPVPTPFY